MNLHEVVEFRFVGGPEDGRSVMLDRCTLNITTANGVYFAGWRGTEGNRHRVLVWAEPRPDPEPWNRG